METPRNTGPKSGREKVLILVKALPHAGKRRGETVCCAGVTSQGEWRRQYPIHFRRLENQFRRWDWIEYDWYVPKDNDRRAESRRVKEDTIVVTGSMPERERASFLNPLTMPSPKAAAAGGRSLTIIRPVRSHFYWEEKNAAQILKERTAYKAAARQLSFFDKELAALSPCPVEFKFRYTTEEGTKHTATCDDWETTAMFYGFSKRYGTAHALAQMDKTFNQQYPAKGMVFAMGTHSLYPDTWLLVGVLRLDKLRQLELAF